MMTPPVTALEALASDIKTLARELGFAACGISGINLGEHPAYLKKWLEAGYAGDMQWMHNHLDKRCQPDLLETGTLAVITLRMDYLPPETQAVKILGQAEKAYISRYALGRDYHKLIRKRLGQLAKKINARLEDSPELKAAFPELKSRAFTDSAPVLERALAQQGGLGWIGKNCMLITPKAGSWFFLGEIYLNLPLPQDDPFDKNHCGQCQACHLACPTQAFIADGLLDARRCISYLTIEHSGSIPVEMRPLIGNRIFGCDDCQLVCPWNRFAPATQERDFHPRHQLDQAELVELFLWDEESFLENTQGSPIRRAGYNQWLRNLALALGNAPATPQSLQALHARRHYPDPIVQEQIHWSLTRLTATAPGSS